MKTVILKQMKYLVFLFHNRIEGGSLLKQIICSIPEVFSDKGTSSLIEFFSVHLTQYYKGRILFVLNYKLLFGINYLQFVNSVRILIKWIFKIKVNNSLKKQNTYYYSFGVRKIK